MNWLADIFTQPSYLQSVVLLSIICAVGLAFGQIRFKGVSLGVTLVFFAGIIVGHICNRLGISVNTVKNQISKALRTLKELPLKIFSFFYAIG